MNCFNESAEVVLPKTGLLSAGVKQQPHKQIIQLPRNYTIRHVIAALRLYQSLYVEVNKMMRVLKLKDRGTCQVLLLEEQ